MVLKILNEDLVRVVFTLLKTKKLQLLKVEAFLFFCDLAGIRTQDPFIKSEMLYQLSYQVVLKKECKYSSVFFIKKEYPSFF